jgi:hypothetical protein
MNKFLYRLVFVKKQAQPRMGFFSKISKGLADGASSQDSQVASTDYTVISFHCLIPKPLHRTNLGTSLPSFC